MGAEGLLFLAAFVGVLGLALFLTRYAGLSLMRFSIPSLLVWYYIVTAYIGIVPLYFGWDTSRRDRLGIVDQDVLLLVFSYSAVTLLLLIVGFIFAHQVLGLRAQRNASPILPSATVERVFFLGLFGITVIVLLSYLMRVPTIAIFALIDGSLAQAMVARSEMGNAFPGSYWRYQLFFGTLLTMCCVYFYADARASRKLSARLLFLVSLPVAVFASVMSIEKAPIVNLIVVLYLAYAVTRGGGYWQPAGKYLAVFMTGLLIAMYVFVQGYEDAGTGFFGVLSRIFTGGISPAYFYVQMFPQHLDFLYGASFPNPGQVLPFAHFPLTKEMMQFIYPAQAQLGIVGSAPTVFWAEMYVNFGTLGVLIAPPLVGIGLYAVQHLLVSLPNVPATIAATILLASHFKELSGTSLSGYMFDTTSLAIVVVLLGALVLRGLPRAVREYSPGTASGGWKRALFWR